MKLTFGADPKLKGRTVMVRTGVIKRQRGEVLPIAHTGHRSNTIYVRLWNGKEYWCEPSRIEELETPKDMGGEDVQPT